MDYWLVYLIGQVDIWIDICEVFSIISGITLLVRIFINTYSFASEERRDEDERELFAFKTRWLKWIFLIMFVFSTTVSSLMPNKKVLVAMVIASKVDRESFNKLLLLKEEVKRDIIDIVKELNENDK